MGTGQLIAAVVALVVLGVIGAVLRSKLQVKRAKELAAAANSASKRKPGWYTDPFDPTGERFWNGAHWTGEVLRRDPSASPGSRGRKGW